jgi:hypothetical protein
MAQHWIFKLIGIIALAFLSLYLLAQARLKSNLETFIDNVGAGVEIKYESATLTLAGSVLIEQGTLHIPEQNIYMSVDEIEFSLGNLSDTLFSRVNNNLTSLPDRIYFRYNNAKVLLTSSFVSLVASQEKPEVFSRLEALGCGSKKYLGIRDYAAMGYESFTSSGELTIERKDVVGSLISRLSGYGWSDNNLFASVEFTFDIANVLNDLDEFSKLELLPTIEYLTLSFKDKGYNQLKNNYCANQEQVSVDEYIDNHISLISNTLMSGDLFMTPDIQSSYRELLQPGTKIDISIKPKASFNLNDLLYYQEENLREILGLTIKLNNFELPPIFSGWTLDQFNDVKVLSPKAIAEKQRIKTIKYHLMMVSQAKKYLNRQVKIIKTNGEVFEGLLVSVEADNLRLNIVYQEGNAEIPFEKHKIKQFYVYH